MTNRAGLSYDAHDVLAAYHSGYIRAVEDVLRDMEETPGLDDLRAVAEKTLTDAKRSLATVLLLQSDVDGLE